ncbi:MAG: GNAT family N-acetyltransferase [Clostridiaceae bacterium]
MIIPMTNNYAVEISNWKYENQYSIYSFQQNDDTFKELMNGDYYAYLDLNNNLLGYFCFGKSARIPTVEPDTYNLEMLDIGLGMMPSLCGKGKGYSFMKAGLDFAKNKFNTKCFRLTVAIFNKRAICLYEHTGFRLSSIVSHKITKKSFQVMTLTV